MPSRTRKSKRRRSLRPEAVLWFFVLVNVLVGMRWSPLTSIRKVRAIGVETADQARVNSLIQATRNVPVLGLSVAGVESMVLNDPRIESARFVPNLFGRATLTAVSRKPVAAIVGTDAYLDGRGQVFKALKTSDDLIKIVPPKRAHRTNLAMCGAWESSKLGQLCENLKAQVPNLGWIVEVGERRIISLRVESGSEVVLGSSDGLPQKIEKLRDLLAERPELLKSVRQLNLTYPNAPVVVRG